MRRACGVYVGVREGGPDGGEGPHPGVGVGGAAVGVGRVECVSWVEDGGCFGGVLRGAWGGVRWVG